MCIRDRLATPAALARAGITGPRTFADASQIVCDVDGTPTGELREPSAMESVRVHIPPLAPARRRELYRAQFARMAASGLVGAHVMDDSPADLADLAALEDEGGEISKVSRGIVHHMRTHKSRCGHARELRPVELTTTRWCERWNVD